MTMINRQSSSDGYILITSLVMLLVVTMLGLMATRSTQVEIQTAGNDRIAKTSFFRADSGIYASPKVIRNTLNARGPADSQILIESISFINTSDNTPETSRELYRKIFGFNSNSAHMQFPLGDGLTGTDILRFGENYVGGGSTEFGSGYDGGGTGPDGAREIFYKLDATGTASHNAEARIEAFYRYLPGTAGGL